MSARSTPQRPASDPPPRLADIHGQERAIGFLRRAWEGGRLAHAYLFTGPAGVGKLTTARALAMGLHCDAIPFDACGACGSCRTITAGTNADVRTILGPLAGKRDISIDQIRELQRELAFRSLSGHAKIGIVNDAEHLTLQAQNALLKTLEEPEGDSLLVLVSVNSASLAPTILSRCQRLTFSPLPAAAVTQVLERHGRCGPDAAVVAAYAEGSPGRALGLDTDFFSSRRREILSHFGGLSSMEFGQLANLAAEITGEEENLTDTLNVIVSWYRDALRRDVLGDAAALQNEDLADRLPEPGVRENLRNLETTYDTINALRRNANRNLALINMLLRLTE